MMLFGMHGSNTAHGEGATVNITYCPQLWLYDSHSSSVQQELNAFLGVPPNES